MKIAVCLFGKTVNKGGVEDFHKGYNDIQKQVLKYNPDVFIHTWNSPHSNLLQKYNPKNMIIEDSPIDRNLKNYGSRCMFYSIKKTIQLKEQYEKEHGFKYDIVLLSRMDVSARADRVEFGINDDMNNLYFSRDFWGTGHLVDHWVYSNTRNLDIIGKIYDKIDEYLPVCRFNNHLILQHHLIENKLDHKIIFKYSEYRDFEIEHLRRCKHNNLFT